MLSIISNYSASIIIALTGAIFLLIPINIFFFIRYRQLSTTLAYLTRGKKAASLEDIISTHGKELTRITKDIHNIHAGLTRINTTLTRSIHHKSVLRYNPFKDLGGDQSFAIALLDGNGDGMIISSLHTRDGTRVYAKPVTNGISSHKLSKEEEVAIRDAMHESQTPH